jgi:hypothetical protein
MGYLFWALRGWVGSGLTGESYTVFLNLGGFIHDSYNVLHAVQNGTFLN